MGHSPPHAINGLRATWRLDIPSFGQCDTRTSPSHSNLRRSDNRIGFEAVARMMKDSLEGR
jgi:hypothetical protein